MGLDQNAYAIDRQDAHLLDSEQYKNGELEITSEEELMYWRKNPHLNLWMAELAVWKGVCPEPSDFNCDKVWLTLEDINDLEEDYKQRDNGKNNMPNGEGQGMFWGWYDDTEKTWEFILKAKEALNNGKAVYYTCWY